MYILGDSFENNVILDTLIMLQVPYITIYNNNTKKSM